MFWFLDREMRSDFLYLCVDRSRNLDVLTTIQITEDRRKVSIELFRLTQLASLQLLIYPRVLLVKQTQRQNLQAHPPIHSSTVLSIQPHSRSMDHGLLCSRIQEMHLAWDSRGANFSLFLQANKAFSNCP